MKKKIHTEKIKMGHNLQRPLRVNNKYLNENQSKVNGGIFFNNIIKPTELL